MNRREKLVLALLALAALVWFACAEPSPPWTNENFPMKDDPMTLVEFLTARLDEDEEATRVGHLDPTYDSSPVPTLMDHGEMYVPGRRWLAEVDAKRRIVAWCSGRDRIYVGTIASNPDAPRTEDFMEGDFTHTADAYVLRLLALPYADHPDYDEGWKP